MSNFNLAAFLLAVLPVILAITVHEAAHGYTARYNGDHTAEQLGRLTLNPLSHIDLLGTIIVPTIMFFTAGFLFGWAKPVPVVSRNFRNVRTGMCMVSIAGPASNFLMMFAWAVLAIISPMVPANFQEALFKMSSYGIIINTVLFVLNMIPILPLDGGRFVDTFLPPKASASFHKIEPYGMWILLVLQFTGVLNTVMRPFLMLILGLVQRFMILFS